MDTTVLYDDEVVDAREARAEGESLWLSKGELAAATGWVLKPEGLCKGEACVPLPADGSWLDADGLVDLAAFARREGRPVVRAEEHSVWAFGAPAAARSIESIEAPDFTLPDVDGKMHSLSDYRGKKVFLHTWGSY